MATRRPRQNRRYRIDHELTADDVAAYRAYLQEPRTTNRSAHARLVARGQAMISQSAVARHMRHFLQGAHERRAAEQFAERCVEIARAGGVRDSDAFLRGTPAGAEHRMFEALWDLRHTSGPATPEGVKELVRTMNRLIELRRQLGQLVDALDAPGARASTDEVSRRLRDLLDGAEPRRMDPERN